MIARNILLIIALILFFFNGVSYIFGNANIPDGDIENKIAYLIGRNGLFIFGFIFLLIAFFLHKKVIRKRERKMVDSLLKNE